MLDPRQVYNEAVKVTTAAEMRAIDRLAAERYGVTGMELMERAGLAVSQAAERLLCGRKQARVLVLCGKGNNGGDGFVAARLLARSGYCPQVWLAAATDALRGDAAANYRRAVLANVPIQEVDDTPSHLPHADLVVDALLGTGLQSDVTGLYADLVRLANSAACPILAVDIPSGLDSDTGQPRGICVRATETVTLGLPKVGMVTYPGREYVGTLTVADIGLPPPLLVGADPGVPLRLNMVTASMVAGMLPPLEATTHKGARGSVLVVAGARGYTGAAVLASEGALRSGAGLVFTAYPESLDAIYEIKLTEAIKRPVPEADGLVGCFGPESLPAIQKELTHVDSLIVGPGLTTSPPTADMLAAMLPNVSVPTVLDADGLNVFSARRDFALPAMCVMTPHPGEMARLMQTEVRNVEARRIDIAKEAAARFERVVVLKGGATIIAEPGGEAYVNTTGNSGMATGGTGDVLSGVVGALMARGMKPLEAAVAGVYLHGLAGDLVAAELGREGMVAGDLPPRLPLAFKRVREGTVP